MFESDLLYKTLIELFHSLNSDLLESLEVFTLDLSNELKESGTIYNNYTLDSLIDKFSFKYPNALNIESLQELKNCNSIGCMDEYYDLIEYMIIDIDI